jgi:hypothetical protein
MIGLLTRVLLFTRSRLNRQALLGSIAEYLAHIGAAPAQRSAQEQQHNAALPTQPTMSAMTETRRASTLTARVEGVM